MYCKLCQENINRIDYKNKDFLRKFVTAQFKIASSQRNKLCKKHQRKIANAIKNARYMALMPYTRNQAILRK
jgi:small subunit ribosomal protein S18